MPIAMCTCVHAVQDKLHGPGKRVMNLLKGGAKMRCTVCKKEHPYLRSDSDRILEREVKEKEKKKK